MPLRFISNHPYVGTNGWIGIELAQIRDEALEIHLREAWEIAARKGKKAGRRVKQG
jgi:hypothetical protein